MVKDLPKHSFLSLSNWYFCFSPYHLLFFTEYYLVSNSQRLPSMPLLHCNSISSASLSEPIPPLLLQLRACLSRFPPVKFLIGTSSSFHLSNSCLSGNTKLNMTARRLSTAGLLTQLHSSHTRNAKKCSPCLGEFSPTFSAAKAPPDRVTFPVGRVFELIFQIRDFSLGYQLHLSLLL